MYIPNAHLLPSIIDAQIVRNGTTWILFQLYLTIYVQKVADWREDGVLGQLLIEQSDIEGDKNEQEAAKMLLSAP